MATLSALAMAVWLSAGLFHPIMQPHTQPDPGLTDGLSHSHVLVDDHPLCLFCFGVLALPSADASFSIVRALEAEEPLVKSVDLVASRPFVSFSNRAPPLSIG